MYHFIIKEKDNSLNNPVEMIEAQHGNYAS